MKKIMILGASILQLPAIIEAKEMGLEVIVVDMNKDAIGKKAADIFLEISTIDIPKVIEAAKQYRIDGIMTLASDMPMRTVASVAKELGIIGISEETAINATNKGRMRECLHHYNVPIPIFYKVDTYERYLEALHSFKDRCVVKPTDNSGSRGVFLIKDLHDKQAIDYAYEYSKLYSRSGDIIIEEYMEGFEVSVETISVDGVVHVIAITDKLTTGLPNFVEMGHSQPSKLSADVKEKIIEVATAAVKAIGIENGPSHTEIIVTSDGPKIVELGARLGGDNITTHLAPLSTGVDMVRACIKIALGEKPDITPKYQLASAIRYFKNPQGMIQKISGIEQAQSLKGVQQISFVKNNGDIAKEINNSSDRIGFVISQAETVEEAVNICERAIDIIKIEVI